MVMHYGISGTDTGYAATRPATPLPSLRPSFFHRYCPTRCPSMLLPAAVIGYATFSIALFQVNVAAPRSVTLPLSRPTPCAVPALVTSYCSRPPLAAKSSDIAVHHALALVLRGPYALQLLQDPPHSHQRVLDPRP
eukprot:3343038-Rhodomonas_salina.1